MGKTIKKWNKPSGFSGVINVPSTVDGNPINKINSDAFSDTADATEIKLPGLTNTISGSPWGASNGKIKWRKDPEPAPSSPGGDTDLPDNPFDIVVVNDPTNPPGRKKKNYLTVS